MTNSTIETDITFSSLDLPAELLAQLDAENFTTPTPIQQQTIPLALAGNDILGTAQTGTGKTLAFALPMVAHLLQNKGSQLIVLVPTRELAQQVLKTFQFLTQKLRFLSSVLLIGGVPSYQQKKDLRRDARIVVGTPGRVIDHINQGNLKAENFNYVVLDEMDRMLDMGFELQLKEIFEHLPKKRQTLMYSATLPDNIKEQAARYLTAPKLVSIGRQSQPAARIEQKAIFVAGQQKLGKLLELLEEHQDDEQATIVFVKTKTDASDLAFELREKNHQASAMHGDLSQSQRQRVLQQFRFKKLNILVATDIAARGIDVSHVGLVINYALPQASEDYIHRIGRTARGGRAGTAISLISFSDKRKWYEILQLTDPEQAQAFHSEHLRGSSAGGQRRGGKPTGGARSGGFGGGRSFGSRPERSGEQRSGGFGARRSFDGARDGERRSFDRHDGERRPFERKEGERRSFERNDGERRPFDRKEGERRSFDRNDGERRSFDRNDGERRSFDRKEGGRKFEGSFEKRAPKRFDDNQERGSFSRDDRSAARFPKKSGDRPAWGGRDERRGSDAPAGRRHSADAAKEPRRWNVSAGKIAEHS